MKTYVTFGQEHIHRVNGKVFDKDCVAVIRSGSAEQGREIAFELFNSLFCFEYPEDHFDHGSMKYFPRGLIEVETQDDEPDEEPDEVESLDFERELDQDSRNNDLISEIGPSSESIYGPGS